jgi:putative transcriptional regulator
MTVPDTAALRKRLGLSQAEFAMRYGLTRDAVRGWEAGKRPQGGTLVLLRLIELEPDLIAKMIKTI